MGRSSIKTLKGMLSTKCGYVDFFKYVHTVLKVHEFNSAHANIESVPFSELRYSGNTSVLVAQVPVLYLLGSYLLEYLVRVNPNPDRLTGRVL